FSRPNFSEMMPILIVDDSAEDAALAQRVLGQCKIQNPLQVLSSGEDCLEYFQKRSEADAPPALVLLDLAMSPVSGLEVLRQLQGNRKAQESIFVILSGLGDYKSLHD